MLTGDRIPIQIVDKNDRPTGAASIDEARQKGLIHRIVRVMVEDAEGRILLQKRNATRDTYPNCWDNSAAGHVDEGESYEQAAVRELREEIGIKGFPLEEIGAYRTNRVHNGLTLNRFNRVYKVTVPNGTAFKIQEEEVAAAKWFSADEVRRLVSGKPHDVSDGLIEVVNKFYSR